MRLDCGLKEQLKTYDVCPCRTCPGTKSQNSGVGLIAATRSLCTRRYRTAPKTDGVVRARLSSHAKACDQTRGEISARPHVHNRAPYLDTVALKNVPHTHGLVVGGRTYEVRARGPGDIGNAVAVSHESKHVLASDRVPDHYCFVCRWRSWSADTYTRGQNKVGGQFQLTYLPMHWQGIARS
jgi:hypothetical protein